MGCGKHAHNYNNSKGCICKTNHYSEQGFIQVFLLGGGGEQLSAVENRGVRGSSPEILGGNDYLRCNLEVFVLQTIGLVINCLLD